MPEASVINPFAEATEGDPLKGVGKGLPLYLGGLAAGSTMFGGPAGAVAGKVLGAGAFGMGIGNAIAPYVFGEEPSGTTHEEVPADGDFKPTSGNKVFDAMLEGGMSMFDYLGI